MARIYQHCWSLRLSAILCVLCMSVMTARGQITGKSLLELGNEYGKTGLILSPMTPIEETVVSLKPGYKFRIYAGALSGRSFSGKLVVAVVRDETKVVCVCAKRNFSAPAVVPMEDIVCTVPDDADIREGDVIRLLTTDNDGFTFSKVWVKPGASSGVIDAIPAVNYELPLVKVNLPMDIPGATIKLAEFTLWPDRALKGTNFFFNVIPDDPENMVVSVTTNGIAIVPNSSNSYAIGNIDRDHDIQIKLYDRRKAAAYKVIACTEETGVGVQLTEEERACLKGLKVTGLLREQDFEVFRSQMGSLELLDLSEVTGLRNVDDRDQVYMPERALKGNTTLKEVKIPKCLTGLASEAFRDMPNLEHVVLHEHLANFGFNEFFNCPKLKVVWVKWNPYDHDMNPALGFSVPGCAFNSTPYKTEGLLIVPKGCLNAYKYAQKWGEFSKIREEAPMDVYRYDVPFENYLPSSVGTVECRTGISVQEGGCRIDSEAGELPVAVYDLSGREVKATIVRGSAFISLTPGFYVVRAGNYSSKVLIR